MAKILAYLVPHPPVLLDPIGKGLLSHVEATRNAMFKVAEELKQFAPDTILLSSPHNVFVVDKVGVLTSKILTGSFQDFGYANLRYIFDNDTELVEELLEFPNTATYLSPTDSGELDHGALVFLDFFLRVGGKAKLVVFSAVLGNLKTYFNFGVALREFLSMKEKRIAYIASGDLSHCTKEAPGRHYHEEGPIFDKITVEAVQECNTEKILSLDESFLAKAEQCGLYSFLICFGLFSGIASKGEVLSYEDPFGVGYLVGSLTGE